MQPELVHVPSQHNKPSLKEFCLDSSSWFLERHLIHAKKELHAVEHLMIYLNGSLHLLHRNNENLFSLVEKVSTPANDDDYVLLKTASHFSIILYEIIEHSLQGKMSLDERVIEIELLKNKIKILRDNYPTSAKKISSTLSLINLCLNQAAECASREQLNLISTLYLSDLQIDLDNYCEKAARLQLNGLHDLSNDWLNRYKINLENTYIIIVGARGPKKDMIEYQYFNALRTHHQIKEKNTATGGIIYSEMLPKQMCDLTLDTLVDDLARDLHNRIIGLGMLRDTEAMNKDVLGAFAPPIIKKLISPPNKCPLHAVKPADWLYGFFSGKVNEKPTIRYENSVTLT